MQQSFWARLLHRWFIQYNPLFLFSAVLVLGGTFLTSKGLAEGASVYGQLGVAAVAELYSAALIGGAALLFRIGQRRSAVMLALLTLVYQADLTLHTEAAANLGGVGVLATGAWLALFVGKLRALGWAMKVRVDRSALVTAAAGAGGLAVFPYVLGHVDSRMVSALVAVWLSALGALLPDGLASVTSLGPLDEWGQTVVRRVVRSVWVIWGLLLSLHVLFWSVNYPMDVRGIVCVLPLLATRWIRSERRVWCVIVTMLVAIGISQPATLSVGALVAAWVLAQRAVRLRRPATEASTRAVSLTLPYRMSGDLAATVMTEEAVIVDPSAEIRRLVLGSVVGVYLALWTISWTGGRWPAHVLALDVLFAAVVLLGIWRHRSRAAAAAVPLAMAWLHLALVRGLVPRPDSSLGWGTSAIGMGFALLLVSLVVSYRLRHKPLSVPAAAPRPPD
jgi:hypothetical protein